MNSINLSILAQDEGGGAVGTILLVIQLAIIVLVFTGFWKTFQKAGKPGWGAVVPIYNVVLLLEIAGKPIW